MSALIGDWHIAAEPPSRSSKYWLTWVQPLLLRRGPPGPPQAVPPTKKKGKANLQDPHRCAAYSYPNSSAMTFDVHVVLASFEIRFLKHTEAPYRNRQSYLNPPTAALPHEIPDSARTSGLTSRPSCRMPPATSPPTSTASRHGNILTLSCVTLRVHRVVPES